MENKKILASIAVVLAGIAGYIYLYKIFTTLGTFIFSFSLSLSLVLFFLLFFQETVFVAWKKFAKIYLSISTAIILYFAFSGGRGGNFGLGGGMDAEGVTMFLSVIFFIVSTAIIIVKSRKLRYRTSKI